MHAGACMAKGKNPGHVDPDQDSDEVDHPTKAEIEELMGDQGGVPVKVPLWFKQQLERITQRRNHDRKRKNPRAKHIPTGYFIVTQMKDWVEETIEELDQEG